MPSTPSGMTTSCPRSRRFSRLTTPVSLQRPLWSRGGDSGVNPTVVRISLGLGCRRWMPWRSSGSAAAAGPGGVRVGVVWRWAGRGLGGLIGVGRRSRDRVRFGATRVARPKPKE